MLTRYRKPVNSTLLFLPVTSQNSIQSVQPILEFVHFSFFSSELGFGISLLHLTLPLLRGQRRSLRLNLGKHMLRSLLIRRTLSIPLQGLSLFDLRAQILALPLHVFACIVSLFPTLLGTFQLCALR